MHFLVSLFLSIAAPDFAFQWQTYDQVNTRVDNLASGLSGLGVEPKSYVGMFSKNCPEFRIGQLACFRQSAVLVPLYDTLGAEAITHILNQAELSVIIAGEDKVAKLIKQSSESKFLKTIIKIGEVTEDETKAASDAGLKLVSCADVEKSGAEKAVEAVAPTPDDLAVICYTSGTTGNPKGVMLTHRNLIADVTGAAISLSQGTKFDTNTAHLSYLPLAHMFEQVVEIFIAWNGGRIGFFRGDPKLLIDDIQALKPTFLPVVPRVLNRLYGRVMDGVSQANFIKRFLFNTGLNSKLAALKRGEVTQDSIWDSLVFSKIRDTLGGRVKMVVTGAAPCSSEVLSFMRAALGCGVFQGYGQSEDTAACTVSLVGDQDPGHVGPPMCNCRVKLVSVPEMNYNTENNEGEVCVKGPIVFQGYLRDEEKTRDAIDEDGWLHTGDVGRWNPNGTLSIIDRKKHIFKLAQGEYIAPEKIEMVSQQALHVGQVFVHGDSLETMLVAVVVPDDSVAARWATDHHEETSLDAVCRNELFKTEVLAEINRLGKDKGLKGFEQVRAIHLHPEPFSVENNLLTPTMKMKRPQLRAFFQKELAEMYEELKKGA